MDRFESITAFVAVAREGGFSAASRTLGVPLPTISRRVADLEAELGVRLFQRSTRRVVLTEQGRIYQTACQRLLDDLRDADQSITGEYQTPRGDLTVTASIGFGRIHLQPIASEFLQAYPDINLRLLLVDRIVNLVEEHTDIAVRIAPLLDSTLIARQLGQVRMVVCASPGYLAARGVPASPDELTQHDCIGWSSAGLTSSWWFHDAGVDRAAPIRVRLSTTIAESARASAEAGIGLAQIPCYQAEAGVAAGRLTIILSEYERAPLPVNLVYPSNRLVPLKLRAFVDFAAPRLAERLTRAAGMVRQAHSPA